MSSIYENSSDYLNDFNNYREYLEALHSEDDRIYWLKSQRKNTKKDYEDYLKLYPNGFYRKFAQDEIDEIIHLKQEKIENEKETWRLVCQEDTAEDYKKYLRLYPKGMYRSKARKILQKIKLKEKELAIQQKKELAIQKEKDTWDIVCKNNTAKYYEKYLKYYPNGIYTNEAKRKIDKFIELEELINWNNNLPNNLNDIESIENLNLSSKNIDFLPKSISLFKKLKKLNLNNNNLRELPDSIGKLKNLEEIYLLKNNIKILPDTFSNLKNLKILAYSNGNIPYWINQLKKYIL